MWDFNIGKAVGAMLKTAPFIVFRMLVYLGIAVGYVLAVGIGAGIGYGVFSIGDSPGTGAFWGGLIGFGAVSAVLYWAREYLLYLVKAGHIAVLVEHMDGRELPGGKGQITYAQAIVKERFTEMSVLFGFDRLIMGILRRINRMVMSLANFLPIPGLQDLARWVNKILNVSLTYLDEIILAYNFRTKAENPWASGQAALILYVQNYKVMLKNAVFLLLLMYAATFVIFLICLAPAAAILAVFPGSLGGWSFIMALVFAWCFKLALIEPLAVAALMDVYFETIEGQTPNAEWDEKLTAASDKFRELKDKAAAALAPEPEAPPMSV